MRKRSLAVGSGKGGVGKTTTAVNLAIYYAKQGFSTALIDLDPLSNVASLLDIEEQYSEHRLEPDASLDRYVLPVFSNLDLLFPGPKTGREDSGIIKTLLFETYSKALSASYDLFIFDLPAGLDEDENLSFLPFMQNLIVVTNPEPTAHVAAGAYIKAAMDAAPDLRIHLWHNRFSSTVGGGLLQRDVIASYNRNMPPEDHLPEALSTQIPHLAFVPQDPALDLLQGTPSAIMNVHRSLQSVIGQLMEIQCRTLAHGTPFNPRLQQLLGSFLAGTKAADEDSFLQGFAEYVSGILSLALRLDSPSARPFTLEEEEILRAVYRKRLTDRKLQHMRRANVLLERKLNQLEDETKLFAPGTKIDHDRDIDREIGLLLRSIQQTHRIDALRPDAAVLLFYFSLYKLLQSPTIVGLLNDFIPFREGSRGEPVRDRRVQIAQLVHRSKEYSNRYFKLIKMLFPVIGRQIETITKTFELHKLLLRDPDGRSIRSDLYAKLLSNFIHDTLYSGLSVVVGFEYRSAAISFQQGADRLGELILTGRRKSA